MRRLPNHARKQAAKARHRKTRHVQNPNRALDISSAKKLSAKIRFHPRKSVSKYFSLFLHHTPRTKRQNKKPPG
jgi:hypothetical protein